MPDKRAVMILLMLVSCAAAASAGEQQAGITVRVEGLRSDKGQVKVELFAKAGFPEDEKQALRGERFPAGATNRVVYFKGVPFGEYAVLAYHDENGDDRLDKGMFGIPKEGWGVSRNVRPKRGPPQFDDSKISVTQSVVECTVRIGY